MPRAIWSGAINFGLVSVPVKLYSAIAQKDIAFHQVDRRSGARIRYKRVSAKTGREVEYENIVKGYEVGDDRYVLIEPEELEALDPKATHTIDVEDFVEIDQIDPIYYEHTYYLAPDRGGEKAYSLLLRAMEESGKIGIGRVVIRTKQYLAAIRPYGRALALSTMLFHDEVVPVSSIDAIPQRAAKVGEREMKMAKQLIGSLGTDFDPSKYEDEYRARVERLIGQKAKGKTIVVEEEKETPQVIDLIEALKASVERSKDGESRKPKRGAGRERTRTRKRGAHRKSA